MTGSTRLTLALGLPMLTVLSACTTWQTSGAIDRLKPDAAAHAQALAGEDVPAMRETGLTLLARLGAYAGWPQ